MRLLVAVITIVAAVAAQPGPRQVHQQMTYDEDARRVLMFGGTGPSGVGADLWSFDGRAWTLLAKDGPPPRESGVMAYDARRKRTVLFGGRDPQSRQLSDTWEWDGSQWHAMDGGGPPARLHGIAAYDARQGVVVLFGPVFPPSRMPRPLPNETWTWDGHQWKQIAATGPADCVPLGMAYDRSRNALLLITTRFPPPSSAAPWGVTEGWEWTGRTWKPAPVAPPQIAAVDANLAAFDKGVVLFEGTSPERATWYWNGHRWRVVSRSTPTRRSAHVMAYDCARRRVVLFGGTRVNGESRVRLGDTWEWTGNAWVEVH